MGTIQWKKGTIAGVMLNWQEKIGSSALASSMGGSYIAAEEKAAVGVVQGGGRAMWR